MKLVLLHALARTTRSMRSLARALQSDGHDVSVLGYPSRSLRLEALARQVLAHVEARGWRDAGDDLGFVGHSMGGVVYRALPLADPSFRCGRSVLLGSPANGSLVAEALAKLPPIRAAYGTGLPELTPARSATLPPLPGPTACIAGTLALPIFPAFWVLRALAPGAPSDSTVLVREALHDDAVAHGYVHAAHSLLPSNAQAQALTRRFFATGSFGEGAASHA